MPLEAQRLGLEAHASDLNPVAVLINKAMIEIPPMFAGRPPVNPEARDEATVVAKTWRGAQGLAEDVRHYGRWMRDEAEKRIGHLYPPVEITPALVRERPDLKPYEGRTLTVIAWLWARTVKSPNPAFGDVDVPLASTFMLSTKKGKETYVEPLIEGREYRFTVKVGAPPDAAKAGTKLSQLHRLSREHLPGVDRNDVLRPRGLLRRGPGSPDPAHAGRRANRRPRRHCGCRHRVQLSLRRPIAERGTPSSSSPYRPSPGIWPVSGGRTGTGAWRAGTRGQQCDMGILRAAPISGRGCVKERFCNHPAPDGFCAMSEDLHLWRI